MARLSFWRLTFYRKIVLDIPLYALIDIREYIAGIFLQRLTDVLQRVFVAGHLVSALCVMLGCAIDFILSLLPQPVAHLI